MKLNWRLNPRNSFISITSNPDDNGVYKSSVFCYWSLFRSDNYVVSLIFSPIYSTEYSYGSNFALSLLWCRIGYNFYYDKKGNK